MSESAGPSQQVLPLLFNRVVGVNPEQHSALRLDRSTGYGYAATAQSVPLGLGEFEIVSRDYPILFTAGAHPTPVALLGLREGENLFVQPDGTWRPNSYVPAYVRGFPFIFVEDTAKHALYVAMDPDADCLRLDAGLPLFEDGKPTTTLKESMAFCAAFRDNLGAAIALGQALDAAGLLEQEEANITFTHGGASKVAGFKVVKPERLDQVSDETFLDWRRRGWLGPIYAHLNSMGRWRSVIDLAVPPAPTTH